MRKIIGGMTTMRPMRMEPGIVVEEEAAGQGEAPKRQPNLHVVEINCVCMFSNCSI